MTTAATTYGISSKFEFGKWNYAVHAFLQQDGCGRMAECGRMRLPGS